MPHSSVLLVLGPSMTGATVNLLEPGCAMLLTAASVVVVVFTAWALSVTGEAGVLTLGAIFSVVVDGDVLVFYSINSRCSFSSNIYPI